MFTYPYFTECMSEAKRSDVPFGHAAMLLLGEGSEATEPYNKYDKIRPHSIRCLQFDQKVRPLSFRPEKFDLFTATLLPKRPKSFAPSRLNQGSLCNPGTTATEAEAHKIEKYRELIDNGYVFQSVALEVQGSLGESSEIFTRFCKINELAAFWSNGFQRLFRSAMWHVF